MHRAHTHAISIAAPVEIVFDLVSDPTRLPRWAPAFARTVRQDGDAWIVDSGERQARIRIRASREHGTVDFLLVCASAVEVGAFSRVVPNRCGTEFVFTQFFADGTSERDLEDKRAVIAMELQIVRALCERSAGAAAA